MEVRSYCGNTKPFIYTVFHSSDQDQVLEILERLNERGYAFCYQSGWGKKASGSVKKASLVMFFLSPAAVGEGWINQAILHCVQNNLPILCIHLTPTALTPAQRLQLNTYQGLMLYEFENAELFYEKLLASSNLQFTSISAAQAKDARRKSVGLVAGSLLLGIALSVILLTSVGGSVKAGSLLDGFGYSGSLGDITQVYIYATEAMDQNQGESRPLTRQDGEYLEILQTGSVLIQGNVEDLNDFAQLGNLSELVFTGNEIADLSPLYGLRDLRHLDVSCNPVTNLEGIRRMDSLQSLNISYTRVRDLSPLEDCPSLETVYLSCDMAAIPGRTGQAAYRVVVGGHHWGEWAMIQEPTSTTEGMNHRVCLTCGKTETQTVPVQPAAEEEPLPEDAPLDIRNVGIKNLNPHIFGGYEEWGVEGRPYGVYLYGINEEYSYVFRKNGVILPTGERQYLGDAEFTDPFKTHIYPDSALMGDYDPNATYTLEASYNGETFTYTVRHKSDR